MKTVTWVALATFVLAASAQAGGDDCKEGEAALAKKDYERAIACFTKAIAANPKDARAFSFRGHSHERNGDFDKAIADCTEATKLDPNNAEANCGLGTAYLNKGDPEKALPYLSRALELNPNYAHAPRARCTFADISPQPLSLTAAFVVRAEVARSIGLPVSDEYPIRSPDSTRCPSTS